MATKTKPRKPPANDLDEDVHAQSRRDGYSAACRGEPREVLHEWGDARTAWLAGYDARMAETAPPPTSHNDIAHEKLRAARENGRALARQGYGRAHVFVQYATKSPEEEACLKAYDGEVARQAEDSHDLNSNNATPDVDLSTLTPEPIEPDPVADELRQIPIELIQPSPGNPRTSFNEESIASLAVSIESVGVLQPLIVRPQFAGHFELIAGERRLRAAKVAGLKTVPCIIKHFAANVAEAAQVIENLQREDLNPIDEARSFAKLTTEGGYTQQSLADKIGKTASHISNRIRLLDLPEAVLTDVAAGKFPPTHARYLLPWAQRKAVMKDLQDWLSKQDETPTVADLQDKLYYIVRQHTRPMVTNQWDYPRKEFSPTDKDLVKLDIVQVQSQHGTPEQRAFNVKVWDKLNKEAMESNQAKEREKQAEQSASGKGQSKGKKGAKKEPENRRQFGWKLMETKLKWHLQEIAKRRKKLSDVSFLLMMFLGEENYRASRSIQDALGLKSCHDPADYIPAILKRTPAQTAALLTHVVGDLLADDEDWSCVGAALIAAHLGVDMATQWKPDATFLECWHEDRLRDLAKRPGFDIEPAHFPVRAKLVEALLRSWPKGYVPPELLTVEDGGDFKDALDPPKAKVKGKGKAK